MADYLDWLLGASRSIAYFGDDDGGRFFHPYGPRDQFGRATLTTCGILFAKEGWIGSRTEIGEQAAWWLGVESLEKARPRHALPEGGRLFEDSGAVFLQCGELSLQMDAGPFGWAGAGHSHADTLSVVVWRQGESLLVDPGTFTYLGDPAQRNWFRGTAAHNTVCVDGMDQAKSVGAFRWAAKPEVELAAWGQTSECGYIDASCRYAGFLHRRRVLLERERLLVLDEIEGPEGEHTCWQTWQLGSAAAWVRFVFSGPASREPSQISSAYGQKEPNTAIVATTSGTFPLAMSMVLLTKGEDKISIAEVRTIINRKAATFKFKAPDIITR
jgi:hypothetical protein